MAFEKWSLPHWQETTIKQVLISTILASTFCRPATRGHPLSSLPHFFPFKLLVTQWKFSKIILKKPNTKFLKMKIKKEKKRKNNKINLTNPKSKVTTIPYDKETTRGKCLKGHFRFDAHFWPFFSFSIKQ